MKRVLVVVLVLGLVCAGLVWWYGGIAEVRDALGLHGTQTAATAPAPGAATATSRRRRGGRNRKDPNTAVPVLAATAKTEDVPIYLEGLGTVQAFNLVQVRPMIDGPLIDVAFREGQDVKQGDVLARIDPRPYQAALDSAVAKKQQDEATLANDKLDAARYKKLTAGAYSSAQQYDTAVSAVNQLTAQVRGDQAQIETAQTQLSYATIRAPFDGRTGIRQVDVGNIVHSTDTTPLTVVTQLKPISVLFTLPQQSLPMVANAMQHGMPEVLAMATGATGQVLDHGQLAVLDNQVDPTTGTIKLKATFPNEQLRLWPGGFVNVRMLVDTVHDATTVPPAAIQRGPSGAYVFIIGPHDRVKRQTVSLGHEDEQVSVVTAGLAAGDQVVTDGAQRLTDKAKVAIAGPNGTAPAPVSRERSAPGTAPSAAVPSTATPSTAQRANHRKAS